MISLKDRIYQMFLNRPTKVIEKHEFGNLLVDLQLSITNDCVFDILESLVFEDKIKRIITTDDICYQLIVK